MNHKDIELVRERLTIMGKVTRAERRLEEKRHRPPSDLEIAELLGESIDWVREYRYAEIDTTSFDLAISDDGVPLRELIEDRNAVDPLDILIREEQDYNSVRRLLLKHLTPMQAKIMTMRFDLDDNGCHTLEEVAQEFGLTRERIRQIIDEARLKMQEAYPELKALFDNAKEDEENGNT